VLLHGAVLRPGRRRSPAGLDAGGSWAVVVL